MKLCDKIMQARKKAGMSQIDLADAMGVSRQSVSKWETGEANPEISKLTQLARTLGVSVDWLLSEEEEPFEGIPAEDENRNETSARPYPEWVENLPRWLGGALKRFGWLFGAYVAAAGFIFALFGLIMGIISRNAVSGMSQMGNGFFSGGDLFNAYQQSTDQMTQMAQRNFSLIAAIPVGFGLLLMIIGIVLAVKLKKWGNRNDHVTADRL